MAFADFLLHRGRLSPATLAYQPAPSNRSVKTSLTLLAYRSVDIYLSHIRLVSIVTVMDDYSRFILAHRLQRDMTSDSFIEVVQEAVDRTGMDQVPITVRTRLLSDNGPGYVSRAFRDYLGMVGIRHILAAPFHPQTNGKLERYHQTLKRDVNQLPYELPSDLEASIVAFVSYYNYRRYHKALGNVTPSDVLRGRREDILRRRREVKPQTIEQRRQHNKALRELTTPQSDP